MSHLSSRLQALLHPAQLSPSPPVVCREWTTSILIPHPLSPPTLSQRLFLGLAPSPTWRRPATVKNNCKLCDLTQMSSLIVLKLRGPKSKVSAGLRSFWKLIRPRSLPLKALRRCIPCLSSSFWCCSNPGILGLWLHPSNLRLCHRVAFSLCVYVSSYKDTIHIGSRPTLLTSSELDHIC